jgi:hypothetical protein
MITLVYAAVVYAGATIANFTALHPLEYVAVNALAGGIRGAHGKFELDYWSAAETEALRRLERGCRDRAARTRRHLIVPHVP